MGKGDRATLAKQKRKREAKLKERRALRSEFSLTTRTREPGTRKYKTKLKSERGDKPTPENKAKRQELMNNAPGCSDDWIDVALANALIAAKEAEALRRYRLVIQSYRRAVAAPHLAPDIMASLFPSAGGSGSGPDEQAVRRLRNARDDAAAALNNASRKEAEAIERHIDGRAMPLPQAMIRIRQGSRWLIEHFGL